MHSWCMHIGKRGLVFLAIELNGDPPQVRSDCVGSRWYALDLGTNASEIVPLPHSVCLESLPERILDDCRQRSCGATSKVLRTTPNDADRVATSIVASTIARPDGNHLNASSMT